MVPVMLTRDPAELYRENRKKTDRDSFRGRESEKLLPRLFVTKKGVWTQCSSSAREGAEWDKL